MYYSWNVNNSSGSLFLKIFKIESVNVSKLFVIFLVLVRFHIFHIFLRFIFRVIHALLSSSSLKLKLNEEKYIRYMKGKGNKFFTPFHFTKVTTRFQKTVMIIISSSWYDFNPNSFSLRKDPESRVKSNLIR